MDQTELSTESSSLPLKARRATNADAAQVKELVFSVMQEFGLAPDPTGLDADLDDIERTFFQTGGLFEVVETPDGTIVATAGLMLRPGKVAELRKMYVRKEFRRQGLGTMLLEHMLEHARAHGVEKVELETNSCLQDAIRLYRRYGFEPIARQPVSRRCDQVYGLTLK